MPARTTESTRSAEPLRGPAAGGGRRVSTLELFFDLVFVFTITQLTAVLAADPSWDSVFKAFLMLGIIWWMYGGYAWLTNAAGVEAPRTRLLLLGGMAGFMVMALAVPTAFDGDGLAFGLGFLVVTLIHAFLFLYATEAPAAAAFRGVVPYNLAIAACAVVGGALGGTAEYVLFAAAFLIAWALPKLGSDDPRLAVSPAHFVERHGLVVIVAIGESVIAVGIGASHLPLEAGLIAVALLGLALSACLWWAYFGGDDTRAEEAILAAPVGRRPRMVLSAYGFSHIPILLGIVIASSALEYAIAHPDEKLEFARAFALGGGVALYFAGEAMFRRSLAIGSAINRGQAAGLALTSVIIGTVAPATVQLVYLVALLVLVLALDRQSGLRRVPA